MDRYPRSASELADLKAACENFVLSDHGPSAKLPRSDSVWTMGSCFAQNLSQALNSQGIQTHTIGLSEGANSPPVIRSLLRGTVTGKPDSHLFSQEHVDSNKILIQRAKVAVMTLGLAGARFVDGAIANTGALDGWRALSMAECKADIESAISDLRALNDGLKIVLTVSPVPLNRAVWGGSPVVADCVSKSTLRVAVAEVMTQKREDVHYWPAFEIVRWLGAHRAGHYAADDGLERHVSNDVVNVIIGLFVERWFEPA